MKRNIQTFLAGVLVIVPFAITGYFVVWLATKIGGLGGALISKTMLGATLNNVLGTNWLGEWDAAGKNFDPSPLACVLGAVLVLIIVFFIGMLTRLYIFRQIVLIVERWITHVPGVKTIYESVRDLMKLFGGDSAKMGRAVLYRIPQTHISVLGILTNEQPEGVSPEGEQRVAVFLPFSYMFGGPTIYVSPADLQDAGMTVDQALKLCATAAVGSRAPAPHVTGKNDIPPETKI